MIEKPLPFRMAPESIDEVLGQKEVVNFLKNLIENETLVSMIFYGEPGTGKTSTARAFSLSNRYHFISLNAVLDNKSKMEEKFDEAIRFFPSIVLIDEIHRMDKGKQDILLPHLEKGEFYLIGCTTANPFIYINSALRSRCKLLEFRGLNDDDIKQGIERAISSNRGLKSRRKFTKEAVSLLAKYSSGDLRYALNQLEVISLSYTSDHLIDENDIKDSLKHANYRADRDEDEHYNLLSAFQKSIRGSDVQAAIYYLARLLRTGDLDSIIRRLLVTAYEDIGLASPAAVARTLQACEVANRVGLKEGRIPLATAVIDLTLSPKSKSAEKAIDKALDLVDNTGYKIKDYLRLLADSDEKYDYENEKLFSIIQYLPDEIKDEIFYVPKEEGKYERALKENLDKISSKKRFKSIKEAKEYLLKTKI